MEKLSHQPGSRNLTAVCLASAILVSCAFSVRSEDMAESFLANTCLECHDHDIQKGGVNIEALLDEPRSGNLAGWEKVLRQIDARQMPPIGEDRPSEAEYETVVATLSGELDILAAAHPDPGRTDSLRRLTRSEYGNAIRDLLGLEVDVTKLLPAEEASHGFENVTVGELSPSLLDRYLSASRNIARRAVGRPFSQPDSRTVRIRPDITQEHHIEGLPLGTRGGGLFSHHFQRSGEYEIQIFLTRDRNEKVEGLTRPHQLEILFDGKPVTELDVKPPRQRNDHTTADANLKARVHAEAGPVVFGVTFLEDQNSLIETLREPYESRFNYHRHPRETPAVYQITITGPFEDKGAGDTPSRRRLLASTPGEDMGATEAAQKNLASLLRVAWRRPVEGNDVSRILPFFENTYEETGDFEAGMESALAAILVSREFLFRLEADPEGLPPKTPYDLSSRELATRLSFFLWSSLPDERLLAAVEAGTLMQPGELVSQAKRMLRDPRAESLVSSFADQWLYLRNLNGITPDGRLYPDFDHNLRVAMREETGRLVADVIGEDRSVMDLLTSNYTWLNERLAKHYGIPHVYGSRFRKVDLEPAAMRGGLLRHGSILTVTSYATRTSPVIRGNWILENLLGTPPPPPPPNVPALDDNAVSADLPIRERLAAHREKAACASCHNLMDPIGFALENYDATGRWRKYENGVPVDVTGALPGSDEFSGVQGLEEGMAARPAWFARTMTEKLLIHALGRGVEPTDAAAVRKIVREAAPSEYRFSDLISGIVSSELFRMRRTAGEEVDEQGHEEL